MIITNGRIVTWGEQNQILEGYDLLVKNGRISAILETSNHQKCDTNDEVLDAKGQLIMPGNICAHTHFYGAFSRGMAIPGDAPADFMSILQNLWWKLDKALDEESIRYSALVCLIDAIKYGTTTVFDHHASPNFIDGSLDLLQETVNDAGIRCSLSYEVTDRDGKERALRGIHENERFIKKVKKCQFEPLVRAHFGLHASLTVSNATLERCLEANSYRAGFHVHAAEGIIDQYDSEEKYKKRVIQRFFEQGVLGPNSILAHGVHTDDDELNRLSDTGTWLSHQPRSNMNNAVGVAPVPAMLEKNVKVVLGNDGFSNAMWEEWKAAYLIQKDNHHDPRILTGNDVVRIAIKNNSELASVTFDGMRIGIIAEGGAADLIFVDYKPITPLTPGNLPWHILFGFRDGMVTTTIVNGKVLMRDRQLVSLDEEEVAAKARESALKVWKKIV